MRLVRTRYAAIAFCVGICLLSGCFHWGSGHGWGVGGEGGAGYEIEKVQCDGRIFLVLAASGCSGGSGPGRRAASMREKLQALGNTEPRIAEFFKDSQSER